MLVVVLYLSHSCYFKGPRLEAAKGLAEISTQQDQLKKVTFFQHFTSLVPYMEFFIFNIFSVLMPDYFTYQPDSYPPKLSVIIHVI